METEIQRIEKLEVSMREHQHSGIDSTTPLIISPKNIASVVTQSNISPRTSATGGDIYIDITNLSQDVTISNQEGTAVNFQKLIIRIKDDGTARLISWGSSYVAGGFDLPTTTIINKIMTCGFFYNTANSLNKWQLVGFAQET